MLLTADGWFDYMSAAPKFPYAQAMVLACFAELPLAVLLAWASWQSLTWDGPAVVPPAAASVPDPAVR